jgi:transcriptional repressor NrdR
MRCPSCSHHDTQVKDTRAVEDNSVIKRKRVCPSCGSSFKTFERIQLRELMVLKRSQRLVPFNRDKLYQSIEIATRKRNIASEQLEKLVSELVREFESLNEGEVTTEQIGHAVMKNLKKLDDVAYVRFASVYHKFGGAKDFKDFLGEMARD